MPGNSSFLPPSPLLVYPFPQLGQLGLPFSTPVSSFIAPPKQVVSNGRRLDNSTKSTAFINPIIPIKPIPTEEIRTHQSWSPVAIPAEPQSISLAEYQKTQLLKQSKQSHPKPIQRPILPSSQTTIAINSIEAAIQPTVETKSETQSKENKSNLKSRISTKKRENTFK